MTSTTNEITETNLPESESTQTQEEVQQETPVAEAGADKETKSEAPSGCCGSCS